MDMYTSTEADFMRNADIAKVSILRGLVKDGLLGAEVADEWAATHTFLAHKPKWGLFSRLFGKGDTGPEGLQLTLVARTLRLQAEPPEPHDPIHDSRMDEAREMLEEMKPQEDNA